MESLGEYLRRERELRAITLREIADTTKISKSFLEALENDKYEKLPAKTFVIGFLRAYAKYVGLSEDEVVINYEHFLNMTDEGRRGTLEGEEGKEVNGWKRKSMVIPLGVVGIIFILFLLNICLKGGEKPSEQEEANGKSRMKITENIIKENEAIVSDEIEIPSPEKQGLETNQLSKAVEEKRLTLRLEAIEETWIQLQIDDEALEELIFQPGNKASWQAKSKFVLNVGNAGGVNLVFNDKSLGALGASGKVIRNLVLSREVLGDKTAKSDLKKE